MDSDSSSNQRQVIQASEILAKIERGEDVEYDGVIVEGDLDISGLELPTKHVDLTQFEIEGMGLTEEARLIESSIVINNSEIRGKVTFNSSIFQNSVDFKGTNFNDHAYFLGGKFSGFANFKEARFSRDAIFDRHQFGGNSEFNWAKFNGYAIFSNAKFNGYAVFNNAKFLGFSNFEEVEFCVDTYFVDVEFSGDTWFDKAQFKDDVNFLHAKFNKDAWFYRTDFSGDATFDRSQFSGAVSFSGATFNMPRSQEIACRIAKRNMEHLGNKEEADYYFYREMEAVRIQKGIEGTEKLTWPWNMQVSKWLKLVGSKIWRLGRYDIFEYVLIQGIFGYGVHPLRLFGFWILMAFAFASFYWYFDAVERASAWFDYLWFSIATSATPGYALYNPIGNYKIMTGIQAIIGTFMWAAFIATFARKWQR